jgi:hypothetical protein
MRKDQEKRIERYLKDLTRELASLPRAEREDIVREADVHIRERVNRHEGDLDIIFEDLGSPKGYAGSFLEQDAESQPLPSRGQLIDRILGALLASALGLVGAFLTCIAGYKLLWPDQIGLWSETPTLPNANLRVSFGWGRDISDGVEILGYGLVPLALTLAWIFFRFAWMASRIGRGRR